MLNHSVNKCIYTGSHKKTPHTTHYTAGVHTIINAICDSMSSDYGVKIIQSIHVFFTSVPISPDEYIT